jgi:hypothetical protein
MRLAIAACLVCGCTVGEGTGTFAGTLFVRDCTVNSDLGRLDAPANYNMNPDFFVAEPIDDFPRTNPMNRLTIRVQPTGNRLEEADVFYINMSSVREVAMQLGRPVEVGPSTTVRATLDLNATCPDRSVNSELDGEITFTQFGTAGGGEVPADFRITFGDRLAATFQFTAVDRRALTLGGIDAVSGVPDTSGQLSGMFNFIVRQGRAAQSYP